MRSVSMIARDDEPVVIEPEDITPGSVGVVHDGSITLLPEKTQADIRQLAKKFGTTEAGVIQRAVVVLRDANLLADRVRGGA